MKNIIVFGDLPIATKVCEHIRTIDNINLAGVVIGNKSPNNNDPFFNTPLLYDYAIEKKVPIYTMSNLNNYFSKKDLFLGITCRFSKIVPKNIIDLFSLGIINFHGGLLPECGGLYSSVHAILEGHKKAGGTIHWLDSGIDTGNIIVRCEFDIEDSDTSYTVYQKTQKKLLEEFSRIFIKIIEGDEPGKPQSYFIEMGYPTNYYNKESLNGLKEVNATCLFSEIDSLKEYNRIRAFDMPGYEPAFLEIFGKKLYLRITK